MPSELTTLNDALPPDADRATVVNETDLPDSVVLQAVQDHFIENASMAWGRTTTFQSYTGDGSMLARREYRTPTNVIDEIKLARDLAERDDDVGAAIGSMVATAYDGGMENFHEDERTVGLFNAACREANMDAVVKEMHREYLISSSVTTVSLFTRSQLEWTTNDGNVQSESVAHPMIGVLPAECIRVIGDDTFGTAQLAYDPSGNQALCEWLEAYFNPQTSPAKKAELGRQNRVAAGMFTGVIEGVNHGGVGRLYTLNPRMVHRSTMPKGAWKYPRPLLTRNFALLEAKRLLNILDFSLLQGGSNFIVVVKKGTDQLPARQGELENLHNVVRAANKTGVIVGDHRISIEVITPDLRELLNSSKRRLIGRKLSMALLRVPESGVEDPGVEGMKAEVELMSRVIGSDRHDIKRHIERGPYQEMVRRNKSVFPGGPPKVWHPKIILQGTDGFTDLVLKLRDRGDIPRKWAVEAAGFDYEAGVQQRQRELESGDDEILIPGSVPHSSPLVGPQDNNDGRPSGGKDENPSRQRLGQNPGETIRSIFDEEAEQVVRIGEITGAILDEYPDWREGRVQRLHHEALESGEPIRRASLMAVPVNTEVAVDNLRSVRLRAGLSMVTGQRRGDGALLAKLLVFREPEFDLDDAETAVARWGFPVPAKLRAGTPEDGWVDGWVETAAAPPSPPAPVINLNVETATGKVRKTVKRGEDGEIVSVDEEPVKDVD